ncbi:M6 metalloprotease [Pleurostoma richardsiae]|uniref:M6 metalloprotease n=1 Tax=Pleurostoma richardsiae TaxID=41990 RepID=A0AA38RQA1_9PEZI|nr:M6 metalloprotease [Pleurostoma richardsiae]
MFFVDFSDQGATDEPQDLHDFFLPAAAEWYATGSYGRLNLSVTADTSRFYRMPATADSYGWQRGLTSEAHQKYIQDALQAYNQTISPVDVLYVVPTANATAISFSPTFMDNVTTYQGTYVSRKAVTFGHDAYTAWGYKVLNHESGHTMCLPDLYPFSGGATGLYIGGWDLMGLISGPAPDYFAWDKWLLGWLTDDEVGCVASSGLSTHKLSPLEVPGGTKAVVIKRNSTFALVAEVRAALGEDVNACSTGVLLYTVSTTTETGYGPIRVLDTSPGTGRCAGDELNDAPLSFNRTTSYTVPDWGATVSLQEKCGNGYTIEVDVP